MMWLKSYLNVNHTSIETLKIPVGCTVQDCLVLPLMMFVLGGSVQLALLQRGWLRQLCVELCLYAHKHVGLPETCALFSLVWVFPALYIHLVQLSCTSFSETTVRLVAINSHFPTHTLQLFVECLVLQELPHTVGSDGILRSSWT